jgi:hypothetical protein
MRRLVIALVLSLITVSVEAKPRCAPLPKRLTVDLTFETVLEKPVRRFIYHGEAAKRFMGRVRALETRVGWPSRTFEEEVEWLLDPSGDTHYEGDNHNARQQPRFKALLAYMRDNLTDLRTAFFGKEPYFEVYVFGRDRCGNVVGVRMVEVT